MSENYTKGSVRAAAEQYIAGGGDKDVLIKDLLDNIERLEYMLREEVAFRARIVGPLNEPSPSKDEDL